MIHPETWQTMVMNHLATAIEDFMHDPVHTPDLFVQWIRRMSRAGLVDAGALYVSENDGLRLKGAVSNGQDKMDGPVYPEFLAQKDPTLRFGGLLNCLKHGRPHAHPPDLFLPLMREDQGIGAVTLTPSTSSLFQIREVMAEDLNNLFRLLCLAMGVKETAERLRKAEEQTRSIL